MLQWLKIGKKPQAKTKTKQFRTNFPQRTQTLHKVTTSQNDQTTDKL